MKTWKIKYTVGKLIRTWENSMYCGKINKNVGENTKYCGKINKIMGKLTKLKENIYYGKINENVEN